MKTQLPDKLDRKCSKTTADTTSRRTCPVNAARAPKRENVAGVSHCNRVVAQHVRDRSCARLGRKLQARGSAIKRKRERCGRLKAHIHQPYMLTIWIIKRNMYYKILRRTVTSSHLFLLPVRFLLPHWARMSCGLFSLRFFVVSSSPRFRRGAFVRREAHIQPISRFFSGLNEQEKSKEKRQSKSISESVEGIYR